MDYAKESLRLHEEWKGKIEVVATVPVKTKEDLSLAYTPGVAQPCLEIQKDVEKSYDLTRRHNMCLVVTEKENVSSLKLLEMWTRSRSASRVMTWTRSSTRSI